MCCLTGGSPLLQQPACKLPCCVSLCTFSGRASIASAVDQVDLLVKLLISIAVMPNKSPAVVKMLAVV